MRCKKRGNLQDESSVLGNEAREATALKYSVSSLYKRRGLGKIGPEGLGGRKMPCKDQSKLQASAQAESAMSGRPFSRLKKDLRGGV